MNARLWSDTPLVPLRPLAVARVQLGADVLRARRAAFEVVAQIAAADAPFDWRRECPELTDDCPPHGYERPVA